MIDKRFFIFLFFFYVVSMTQAWALEQLKWEKGDNWDKLNKCQKETSAIIVTKLNQQIEQAIEQEKKMGSRFKEFAGRISIFEGNDKGGLQIVIMVDIIESNNGQWLFAPTTSLRECPKSDNPALITYIEEMVKMIIFQIKIQPNQVPL